MTYKHLEKEIERCKPMLVPAIDREEEVDWDWVKDGIINGDLQLWPGDNSAIVTRVLLKKNYDELQWMFAGGELEEIANEMRPVIEEWARNQNIQKASLSARPGWERCCQITHEVKQ